MRRPTKAVVEARTVEIFRMMLDGAEAHDLREYVHEAAADEKSVWYDGGRKLSNSQIYRYSQRAWKMIAETCRGSRKRLLRRHLAQRRNLVGKSIQAGDLRTALAAMESEAKLLRLHEEPSQPAPPTNSPPATIGDVARVLAGRLQEIEEAKDMPAVERVKLTTALAGELVRALAAGDLERQLRDLMARIETIEKLKGDK